MKKLFPLGEVVLTPGAVELFGENMAAFLSYLNRHQSGDWGDLDDADKKENDLSVKEGFRILSSYKHYTGTEFWIITEADRSATTVLLPEEY